MAVAPPPAAPPPTDAAMPPGGAAPADDMGAMDQDEGAEPPVLFTVMGKPGGPYVLMAGDEPEGEGAAAGAAPTFDTPQALMKAIMQLLNNEDGAEDSFAKGFKGEDDPTAAKPDMPAAPGM